MLLTGCSTGESKDWLLKDPSRWPLAALPGSASRSGMPNGAEKVLARIRVAKYDMVPWIHSKGVCGLADQGSSDVNFNMSQDLTKSEGNVVTAEAGFAGPREPMVGSDWESTVTLWCTPTRMFVTVEAKDLEKVQLFGNAAAKKTKGRLTVVVGTPEAVKESLPDATLIGR
ncbi:hypothetical protein ACFFV7_46930 [Nonomuraea spiralis]|uniref:Lipoprotein n=1 Tax=Nonomuraea spiralis TaxID=46182 RepID=A0ABV5IXN8_9ACTN|nr:hypothetical protein [Nonomuraea spiralis]GGS85064.1 hypothetical protein GCM10010176_030980 [Nonomuraea spiralis]